MKLDVMNIYNHVKNKHSDTESEYEVETIEFVYEETLRNLLHMYQHNVEHEVEMTKLNLRKDWELGNKRTNEEMIDSVTRGIKSIYLDLEKNLKLLKETVQVI